MNEKILIVCSKSHIDLAREYKDYYTIGVERGCLDLIKAGLPINYAVGDFDSVSEEEYKEIEAYSDELVRFPAAKDLIDGEIAVQYAVSRKPQEVVFIADGSRIDMTIAAVGLVAEYDVILRNDDNYCYLLKEGNNFVPYKEGYKYISFLSFDKSLVNIRGFLYNAENLAVTWKSVNATSNEFVDKVGGNVEVFSGQTLAFYCN